MVLNVILLKQFVQHLDAEILKTPLNGNNTILREEEAVTYLGTVLSNNTKHHIDTRIKATHRAFYGLQSAGLCAEWCVSHSISTHA